MGTKLSELEALLNFDTNLRLIFLNEKELNDFIAEIRNEFTKEIF